jgi:NADH-quinone oxidoreductase subunit L
MFALAKGFNAIETSLLQAVFGIGTAFLAIARWLSEGIDRATAYVIDSIGAFNLNIARMSSFTDDKGIVEGIAGLVDSVQRLGHYGRKMQSGLIHRELAWSVYGMVFAFIIILLTYL